MKSSICHFQSKTQQPRLISNQKHMNRASNAQEIEQG